MDNLKFYAVDHKQLETLLQILYGFINGIDMSFRMSDFRNITVLCLSFLSKKNKKRPMEIKKRKVEFECRNFNDEWTLNYFSLSTSENVFAYFAKKTFPSKKFQILKDTMKLAIIITAVLLGEDEVARLRNNLTKQSSFFVRKVEENERNTRASYEVSKLISENMKPFSDGKFFKRLLLKTEDVVCPEKKMELFSVISLSARTVTRRIGELAANVRSGLKNVLKHLEYYSIAIDETTDMKNTCQLAVFMRDITPEFDIVEEFVQLIPMKHTSTGADILKSKIKWFTEMNRNL
ncbi:general transcription factor II-I repeat domain-containing protein 2-like isoform X2 [Octopus bimaculoides]|uniref:general transcription factor II-I repeat domain-containing protein 2-like isoform X2 n=2 Tax=Octopus bimaculoides TaxID=37653 RepID=UPI0022E3AAD8|nr:general transcription factor II-I repeat domain-containing protein 2-like isoform X2 [Octopus bimaculoides]